MLGPSIMLLGAPLALGYAVHAWRGGGHPAVAKAALVVAALETVAVLAILIAVLLG